MKSKIKNVTFITPLPAYHPVRRDKDVIARVILFGIIRTFRAALVISR